MLALRFLAAFATCLTLTLSSATHAHAGDWLGGQYWGQIAGCAHCGGSMYGGGLPPGAIWVGEIGWGGGPGCGCDACKLDIDPIMTGEEVLAPTPVMQPEYVVPGDDQASNADDTRRHATSRRVTYIERIAPVAAEFRDQPPRVKTVTHVSQPERLRREPIRIVSPDGSTGRMYR